MSRVSAAPAAPGGDPAEQVRRNLPLLLLQARERLIARFRPVLNAHGITEQQYRVLRAIQVNGPLEPREIGALCHLSSPSLAGVLARMEGVGLLARERLPHDQRRLRVSLTPAGRALFRRMWPRVDAVYQALEADLGAELTADLYRNLDSMLDRLAPACEEPCEP